MPGSLLPSWVLLHFIAVALRSITDRVTLVEERVKRQYRSPARTAAAEETRARIRAAALELFVARGFQGTTLKDVADRAGVGERTLYDSFGNKLGLLRHTIAMLTMGDESRVRAADRPEAVAARELDDPREALAAHLKGATDLMNRAGDLILVGDAVPGVDPGLARTVTRGNQAAYELNLKLAQRFADAGRAAAGPERGGRRGHHVHAHAHPGCSARCGACGGGASGGTRTGWSPRRPSSC